MLARVGHAPQGLARQEDAGGEVFGRKAQEKSGAGGRGTGKDTQADDDGDFVQASAVSVNLAAGRADAG